MAEIETEQQEEPGAQMSFLEHLDELRKRVVNSVIILVIAFAGIWFVSDRIYNLLEIPIKKVLSEVNRVDLTGMGDKVLPLTDVQEGDHGRYVFDRSTQIGIAVISPGASVQAVALRQNDGNLGLFTNE